jgi:putative endonuclease
MRLLYTAMDWLRDRARRRTWDKDRALGARGEDLAHRYLRAQGYTVIARNFRTRSGSGEVDIIAWDGPALAFVEVKTRSSEEFGTPDRAVDADKQHKLLIAARDFTRRAGLAWSAARFDIVSIVMASGQPKISVIRDAFAKGGQAAPSANV